MKPARKLLAILFTWVFAGSAAGAVDLPPTNSGPRQCVIGLSPFLDQSVKDDVFRQIVGFVLESMPLGSSLAIFDAYRLQTIAHIKIPEVAAFRSGKTRANQFKDQLNSLKQFLAAEHPRPEARGLNLDQAVRLPQFLDFVADNVVQAKQPVSVIVLGSPLYLDAKEPGFSMVDGYFPSDGHLLAGREQSVFGVRDRSSALSNVVVNLGYFGDPWVSEVHAEKVRRFWALFLSQQQGRLGTFCADLPTVFAATQKGDFLEAPSSRFELDSTRHKIEMVRITRDLGPADWITRESLPDVAQPPPRGRVGPMKIGIRWQGDIDLDLYATPARGAETLFFEHPRSSEGYYFKDHRSSPLREYEFIEFESPVDIEAVEARINFYAGETTAGPAGEIRIEFEGKLYSGRFALEARHGNKGRSGPNQSDYWARIDIPAILRVTEARRDSARLRDR